MPIHTHVRLQVWGNRSMVGACTNRMCLYAFLHTLTSHMSWKDLALRSLAASAIEEGGLAQVKREGVEADSVAAPLLNSSLGDVHRQSSASLLLLAAESIENVSAIVDETWNRVWNHKNYQFGVWGFGGAWRFSRVPSDLLPPRRRSSGGG
jgi:hypothetical protein